MHDVGRGEAVGETAVIGRHLCGPGETERASNSRGESLAAMENGARAIAGECPPESGPEEVE
jgi:hypothetical protein